MDLRGYSCRYALLIFLADFIISQKDKEVNLCVNKKGV